MLIRSKVKKKKFQLENFKEKEKKTTGKGTGGEGTETGENSFYSRGEILWRIIKRIKNFSNRSKFR